MRRRDWCIAVWAASLGITGVAAGNPAPGGIDPWRYAADELRFLQRAPFWGEESMEPAVADPLPAVEQMAALAENAGIQFLLLPVPPKALIYPESLGLSTAQTDRAHALLDALFTEFRARGITALDLRPIFLAQRDGPALYTHTDRCWSGVGLQLAARAVAQRLRERGWTRPPLADAVRTEKDITFTADQAQPESLRVTTVTDAAGLELPLDPASTVILMGDRQVLIFHDGRESSGAGFPDHLACELGRPVDLVAATERAAEVVRSRLMERLREKPRPPETWCIVWCFTLSALTEAPGWDPLPLP